MTGLSVALFWGCLLGVFGAGILGNRLISDSDVLLFDYPLRSVIHRIFRESHSLAWNRFLAEGQPLAANPKHEIYYPFTWLLLVLPTARAVAIMLVAHVSLTWIGTRRFLRKLRVSEAASLIGAITWTFGGVFVSMTLYYPFLHAWTWVPWALAEAADPAETRGSALRSVVFLGLVFLVGEPVTGFVAVLSYGLVYGWRSPGKRRLAALAGRVGAALLLAGATLVPGFELMRKGIRGTGIPGAAAMEKTFPALRAVELVAPRVTGDTRPHRHAAYLAWRLYPERHWPLLPGLYAGAILLPLAAVGVAGFRRRLQPLIAAGAAGFLLSLGNATPAWKFLLRIFPPWRAVRYPEKLVALFLFAAAVAVAFGFDAVRRRRSARRFAAAWTVLVGGAFGLTVVGALLFRGSSLDLSPAWSRLPMENAGPFFLGVFSRAALSYLAWALVFVGLGRAKASARTAWVAAATAFAAVDLLSSSRDFVRTRSREAVDEPPPVIRRLVAGGHPPRLIDALPDEPPTPVAGSRELSGAWDRNRVIGCQAIQWGVPLGLGVDFDLTYLGSSDRAWDVLTKVAATDVSLFSRLLAGRSNRAVLAWKRPITLEDPVTVLGVPGCRPEVDSATAVARFRGDTDFVRQASRRGDSVSRTVFVEGPGTNFPDSPAEARILAVRSDGNRTAIALECSDRCVIRVARTNDGNWRARLDGRAWPVETVDFSLIGIVVPRGRHDLRLSYFDPRLWAGAGVSLAAALVLVMTARRLRRSEQRYPLTAGSDGTGESRSAAPGAGALGRGRSPPGPGLSGRPLPPIE